MASTVWRGFITFGLISIPVRLFRAARAERVQFRRLVREEPPSRPAQNSDANAATSKHAPGATGTRPAKLTLVPRRPVIEPSPEAPLQPIQQASVRAGSDRVLPAQAVVKGYEYQKNRFVEVDPEELKAAAAETSREMQIQEFVKLAEIDPVYFETSYYLAPEEAGEKAYALLYESMRSTGLVAIAQLAMHSREHVVVVRPGPVGLLVHTMFFGSEVRSDEEYRVDASSVSEKEMALAKTLIHSLATSFEPDKYRDTYREKVEAIIAAKLEGRPVKKAEVKTSTPDVDDLTEALHKSLANLKKPAAVEQQTPKAKRKSRSSTPS